MHVVAPGCGSTEDARCSTVRAAVPAVLVGLHATLFLVASGTLLVVGPDLNDCAYVECGSDQWVSRAFQLHGLAGAVLVLSDVVLTSWRINARRSAVWIPVFGALLHVLLVLVCLLMVTMAGPIDGLSVNLTLT